MKYYSGIGARTSPQEMLELMTKLASELERRGYILRSGGATGADTAFYNGVDDVENSEIFRPEHATPKAIAMAETVHHAWHRCNDYAKKLHGRNSQIILGKSLDSPAEFVICWTPNGNRVGGSGLGMRLADKYDIPVYNLAIEEDKNFLIKEYLNGNVK